MKNLFIYAIAMFFMAKCALAQDSLILNVQIDDDAVNNPLSLPVWKPNGSSNAVLIDSTVSTPRFIVPFSPSKKPETSPYKSITSVNSGYGSGLCSEEVIYRINLAGMPLTIIQLKIPDGLKYDENSFLLNETGLTDKKDSDELVYLEKDAVLQVIPVKSEVDGLKIEFTAKVLDENVENSTFCYIRFKKLFDRDFSDWQPFPF